jgi:hypothetical protein
LMRCGKVRMRSFSGERGMPYLAFSTSDRYAI